MRSRGIRRLSGAALLLAALSLSACGGDDSEPTPTTSSAAPSPEDAVIGVVEDYWAERIRVENSGDYESADFSRILDGSLSEPLRAQYATFGEGGFSRTGEPELTDYAATISGDTATVTMCVNEDEWGARAEAQEVEQPDQGTYASAFTLAQQPDDSWLITAQPAAPAGVSC